MRSSLLLLSVLPLCCIGQRVDTLRFTSSAFGTEREMVIHTPAFHRYAAEEVNLPVIILLDGQHEWLIEPLLNDIDYLQYTHEVPQAIVVTIPIIDRFRECSPDSLDQPTLPLLQMITDELPKLIAPYHPSDLTILVGHSFSASFALYANLRVPDAFDAVIAFSPGDMVDRSVSRTWDLVAGYPNKRVFVAVGGAGALKDGGHFARLKPLFDALDPAPAHGRSLFREYPSAGHTSLPVIAFPELLSNLFEPFALRDSLAPVDDEYALLAPPPSSNELLAKLDASLKYLGDTIPWEVAEINGLASRVISSGYNDHGIAIYERAIRMYPNYYEFHWSLGELLLENDQGAGLAELQKAITLLEAEEQDLPERMEIRELIEALMR